jgi:deoxyribose-phosphate aldolase
MNTPTLSIAEPAPFDAAAFAAHALASPAALAAVLDHTLLKPEATRAQVIRLCHEAAEHRFACAMVNPTWVACAAETLAGTGVPVGVVVGFPLGATLSASKRDETARVLKLGAHDLDMVLNIGLLKSGGKEDYEAVRQDIRGVVELAHGSGAIVKVMLETCLLTFEEKHRASELALSAGADFIKTSTGFLFGRRHGRRHCADARGRRQPRGGEGLGRHPLARRRKRHAARGRNPHRRQRQREDPGGAGRACDRTGCS